MIILDTNVLSEPMRKSPDPHVTDWLARVEDAATTSVSSGELLAGVATLPPGRRRTDLARAIEAILHRLDARMLSYDSGAAREYAAILFERRSAGRGISVQDAMIAAICRSRGASLATRNTKDFDGLGLEVINPWS